MKFLILVLTLAHSFLGAPFATAHATSSSTVPMVARDSYSDQCSVAKPCKGDMTYYQAGLGACGTTNNGDVERVVALSHLLMGTLANNNPYCGRTITIKCLATGKTTTATVLDKCMGCSMFSIDLSNAAFEELEELGVGRTTATWWFN